MVLIIVKFRITGCFLYVIGGGIA